MYLEDFNEFKETLNAFHQTLRSGVQNDEEYEGSIPGWSDSMVAEVI